MTPSLQEEEEKSSSTFEKSSTSIITEVHNERLVVGPDGNKILCDSPNPALPPTYSGPDEGTSTKDKRPVNNRNSSVERSKPRRVIGNYTLINTLV